ncbi:MAG: PEP-CTERM sorting domain-containing protein [Myxococcota bacterium]|nr:PEP-CTERM sorting domain-containing protein [Myxococcota bacterium]
MGRLFPVLVVALLIGAPPVSANLIYLTDDRSVSAFGQACVEPGPGQIECDPFESEAAVPGSLFAPFDAAVSAGDGGAAAQTSSLDLLTGAWTATGSADSFSDVGFGEGTSTFEIGFQLTSPANVALGGFVEAEEFFGFGEGRARVRLAQGATTVYLAEAVVNGDFASELVDFAATLGPGDYTLLALADGYGGSCSTYDLDFTFEIVPEPATSALAAVGLLALALLRRRPRLR